MKLKGEINILADKITKHPFLKIFERTESPGVNPRNYKLFKDKFGIDLPAVIQDLYGEMNGFTFIYGLKDSSDKALNDFNALSKDYIIEKGPPYIIGSIKFLPFEKVFLENTWEGMLYNTGSKTDENKLTFRNKEYTYNDLGKQLKPFDLFSEEVCASFLLIPELSMDVILLTDHYADWQNSRIISFEDYCTLIVNTGGIVEARERYLAKTEGDSMKKFNLPDNKKLTPKIFK